MNARQANMVPITDYLNAKGIRPERSNKNFSMYKAPYREDTAPSLKVSYRENLWIDYGEDNNGGTLIDLVLKINPNLTVSEAIKDIHQTTNLFFSFHQQREIDQNYKTKRETRNMSPETRNAKRALPVSKREKPDARNETPKTNIVFGNSKQQAANSNLLTANSSLLLAEREIAKSYTVNPDNYKSQNLKAKTGIINSYYLKDVDNNPAITNYLNQRGIEVETATPFCKEIYYQVNNNRYFGLGNENNNGWSIRNKYWKGCTAQGYSYYKGGFIRLCVFEGIFDLLSFIELNKDNSVKADFLVLNSLVNLRRAILIIESYCQVDLFLDYDQAGRNATKTLMDLLPNSRDKSGFYSSFKDLNDYQLAKNNC